ncbi:CoA-binding protein [Intrasporangium oryzae NRRL B-24470]|uniref:CoA-binding protein n=1 Tax=Intrasporangium oryzae NRRL B-24470 TaxID=1386089 RepID=W9G757_9MICO|nr:CoA-binding protein [Intrasporangium oryzae]EWT01117.1 CoA-binding protein [Intrasporangium oryzae NRRL B-24470]
MSPHRNDPSVIRDLLQTPATWAVVGLGDNPGRTAYPVSRWLQRELGMRLVPIHPSAARVHGAQGYSSLSEVPDGTTVSVVDCFVNSAHVGAVVDEAIAERERLGIEAVWLQLGVVDEDAAARAEAAGLAVVMDTCPKIEFPRLVPGDGTAAIRD